MRLSVSYALAGCFLGLGAPLGSLVWRLFIQPQGGFHATLGHEWQIASYYYLYMTLGSVMTFGAFGYILGHRGEALSTLSVTDGLTGIYNHRYLQEQLAHEVQRADRYHTPLTCLMLDIDDFKKVNDQHGHLFGDKILKTAARLIQDTIRGTDVAGRYGGEEFLIIMPQTTADAALPIADRIVKAVQEQAFTDARKTVHVTVSIGLAMYPAFTLGIKTKSSLLSAADQALYRAKRSGKNQTVIYS